MRVLLITSTMSEKSGWGRHSRAIYDALLKAGAEVESFADNSRLTPFSLMRNCLAARAHAKSFDIVHAIDGWPYGVYALVAVWGTKKKLFINGIGTYSVAPLYHFGKSWLLRRAYFRAKNIFSISAYTRDAMIAAGVPSEKVVIVHYGLPQFPAVSTEEGNSLAARFEIKLSAKPVVLTVGAVKERKGQFDTLQAVEILKKTHPNILYIMAGSGNSDSYESKIREYARANGLEKNVKLLSDIDDVSLSFLYERCDIFALNSITDEVHHHFEGFGAAILEANMFGKPAVGSRSSGIEDAIEDGKGGLLSNQRDPKDIADKIARILNDYDRFALEAKKFSDRFSWYKTAALYMNSYAS